MNFTGDIGPYDISSHRAVQKDHIRVFPKWSRIFIEFSDFSEFGESDKLLKHELGSHPVSHICLARPVVASWSLTHEVGGSNPFNDNYFCR